MKRKSENCEVTGTEAKVRRITGSMSREQVLKTREISTEREIHSSQTNITDLPLELMLQIFSLLSLRDLCQCVAPVCKKWSILARIPSLRKELSFGKDVSISHVRRFLQESPLLRRLGLKDRRDTDAILRRVRRSNRHIETLEMLRCRGSARRREVNGEILTRVLDSCPEFSNLDVSDAEFRSFELYKFLGRVDRPTSFQVSNPSVETVLFILKESTRVQNVRRVCLWNGENKKIEEVIALLSPNS
jgi:hypothetical protein